MIMQTKLSAKTYEVPKGEELLWHVLMSPKKRYDEETGELKTKPHVRKFGMKTFRKLSQAWTLQGYEIEVLHDPEEWQKKQQKAEPKTR